MGKQRLSASENTIKHRGIKKPKRGQITATEALIEDQKNCQENKRLDNFKKILYKMFHSPYHHNNSGIVSFRQLFPTNEEPKSIGYIPSIENLISEKYISMDDDDGGLCSGFSFQNTFSERVFGESVVELHGPYVHLLEKIKKNLRCRVTPTQNRAIMRGAWNILCKFWKDIGIKNFSVGRHIEWGLLELINFDFNVSPRQKFEAQERINEQINSLSMI